MDRTTRLINLLRGAERTTIGELASALAVSERTVRRDLERAAEFGAVLDVRAGRHGGVRLVRDESLPALRFTDDEALVLALALGAAAADPRLATPARTARSRLSRVLTERYGQQVAALAETVSTGDSTTGGHHDSLLGADDVEGADLFALCLAVARRRRVEFTYRPGNPAKPTIRRPLDPYGVVQMAGHWYVVGHCGLRRDTRMFRVDRVRDVVETDITIVVPDDIDVEELVAAGIRGFGAPPHHCEFLLGMSMDAARTIAPAYRLHLRPADLPGFVHATINADDEHLSWVAQLLSALDCEVRVVGPPELRVALTDLAGRIAGIAAS